MVRGVPTLTAPHTVCNAGDALNANQVQLLKLFQKPLAIVRSPTQAVVHQQTNARLSRLQFQVIPQLCVRLSDGVSVGGTQMEA